MPCIFYEEHRFSDANHEIIEHANELIEDYAEQGLSLTLRQLYYRFVAADLLPNSQKSYDKLGDVISNARLAGLVDWDAIEDRGRNLIAASHWAHPRDILKTAAGSYNVDRWQDQPIRCEVWVEKQALEGVVGQACDPFDVAYFACKGYTSQSEMWRASQRFKRYNNNGQGMFLIHLGDHDPSGIDMTRDISDRINKTFGLDGGVHVERIALNMDQIREYRPPPNPAKMTDSRAGDYVSKYGASSWELDALEPRTLVELIRRTIKICIREPEKYKAREAEEKLARQRIAAIAERWDELHGGDDTPPPAPTTPEWMAGMPMPGKRKVASPSRDTKPKGKKGRKR